MSSLLFEAKNLTKGFPGVQALSKASLQIQAGEIIGLVGENGAGKSTLLNIISGIYRADNGEMFIQGKKYEPKDYQDATRKGVARVFQELALVPNLTVYENIFLSHESIFLKAGIYLDKNKMIKKSKEILSKLNLDIDPNKPVDFFSFSTKQAIEIAKACSISSELFKVETPLILLDEPTSSLSQNEIKEFYNIIDKLKHTASFIFVSHRLSEILQISDIIYIMKDGEIIKRISSTEVNEKELHELMVGRVREEDYYQENKQLTVFGNPVLSVTNLSKRNYFENFNLEVKEGEIVGIAGVIGSGKAELGKALAGTTKVDTGSITINEHDITNKTMAEAIKMGIGYIPEERNIEGIIDSFPISWNISLSSLNDIVGNKFGLLNLKKERETAKRYLKTLSIKAPHEKIDCGNLSGGNQQKVVLSKWLMRDLKLLILDNPTRGIDPGAKAEIYELLRDLTNNGVSIIVISDELVELIGISNRILIMKDGILTSEMDSKVKNKPSEKQLISYMV
ncbi:sugar ABC transporter ATP-binding protein [Alteribacillus sp. YIM 98480]|uniref:sugar ABC transporter ATP-binding protein n=1 Tax=Alteribacillus sp. YIM 98480 TaxID=2606599 RepID=UPI00131BAAA8|nr:sugar ABC transporter ATP-binding protein [Alteribacillus sp. YIM 98480]